MDIKDEGIMDERRCGGGGEARKGGTRGSFIAASLPSWWCVPSPLTAVTSETDKDMIKIKTIIL